MREPITQPPPLSTITVEQLEAEVGTPQNRGQVLRILESLEPDAVMPGLMRWLSEANKAGSTYYEIRTLLYWLGHEFQPRNYLEVGVRRGWSMACVAGGSATTDLYGVDLWLSDYADTPNPGPRFVHAELSKLGYTRPITLIGGNSHNVLPRLFKDGYAGWVHRFDRVLGRAKAWPQQFDLITVDGDHTIVGARMDLLELLPRCTVGGVLVMDDLQYEGDERHSGEIKDDEESLLTVWREMESAFPNFRFLSNLRHRPATGLAIRLR